MDRRPWPLGASASCAAVTRDAYKTIAGKHLKKAFPEQVLLFKSDDFSMPLLVNNPNHRDEVLRLMAGMGQSVRPFTFIQPPPRLWSILSFTPHHSYGPSVRSTPTKVKR